MPIKIKCAWCGSILGVKEGVSAEGNDFTHTICSACVATLDVKPPKRKATWDGIERRSAADRRTCERRRSTRNAVTTLIILDGVTWIDDPSTDRRGMVRRRDDRDRLVESILGKVFD